MNTHAEMPSLPFQVIAHPNPVSEEKRLSILTDPGFGKHFTDHMVDVCWTPKAGWHRPRVQPYGAISLDPSAAVLHYGQEIFEGLKAYRHADGSIWSFRPEENAKRFARSAARLALPEMSEKLFMETLKRLIAIDGGWVPSEPGTSLYLRPFMFANEAFLGVRAAEKVAYYLIASPAGNYFSKGVSPIRLWLSETYTRSGRGGNGAAKTGGNYAASLLPQREATEHGCDQVLFLDASTGTLVEELGGMNIVFVYKDGTLVTPSSDTILEGITRDTILQMAQDRGHRIERRDVSLQEWKDGVASGDIVEIFACGTAAVITPIGQLLGNGFECGSPDALAGEITMSLRNELTGIQSGLVPDRHEWMTRLDA